MSNSTLLSTININFLGVVVKRFSKKSAISAIPIIYIAVDIAPYRMVRSDRNFEIRLLFSCLKLPLSIYLRIRRTLTPTLGVGRFVLIRYKGVVALDSGRPTTPRLFLFGISHKRLFELEKISPILAGTLYDRCR